MWGLGFIAIFVGFYLTYCSYVYLKGRQDDLERAWKTKLGEMEGNIERYKRYIDALEAGKK